MHLRLKENMQAKNCPSCQGIRYEKAGPKTFVKEQNGIVSHLNFVGYFRGGGYEAIDYCICPLYDIPQPYPSICRGMSCTGNAVRKCSPDGVSYNLI